MTDYNPYGIHACAVCAEPSIGTISDGAKDGKFIHKYYCDIHWKRKVSDKKKHENQVVMNL